MKRMFILSDPLANANKFWSVEEKGSDLLVEWGRVGNSKQSNLIRNFVRSRDLDKKIAEKTKKGYREIEILGETATDAKKTVVKNVKAAAVEQLAGSKDPVLIKLIEQLAEINRHDISMMSGGEITIDASTLAVKTPLGAVTPDNVKKARDILSAIASIAQNDTTFNGIDAVKLIGDYFMLVPQRVSHRRGWHTEFFTANDVFVKQNQLLDALESAAENAIAAAKSGDQVNPVEKLFDCVVSVAEDSEHDWVSNFFKSSINKMHTSSHLRPVKTYRVEHRGMSGAFKEIAPVEKLWHGTRAHNVLSILKSGLIVPKSGGSIAVTGRMFGDGLYFSDQSTKSLNYAHGYWDGGAKDDRCFMFVFDVSMGNSYVPPRPMKSVPSGYDSMRAIGGKSGVMNNEMIVYSTTQAKPRYLVEFGK